MAHIQSLGVGSGLLTSDLVDDIIGAEREATDLRLEARRAVVTSKVSAFGTVRNAVDQLREAVSSLGSSQELLSNRVTSSNEAIVTASAEVDAQPGIHSVEVLALARNHTLVSQAFDDTTSPIGDGQLDIRIGTTTFSGSTYTSFEENPEGTAGSVTIDGSNSSLTGIRDAINAANLDVSASIINDGEGFRMVLTSADSGVANSLEITATQGTQPGLAAFAFNSANSAPGTNFTQTVVAEDALLTVDGVTVSRSSNRIDEVIEGMSLTINALNPGAPVTLSVARDDAFITEQMQTFVDAYNDVKSLTDELTEFDPDVGFGNLLIGDSVVRGLRSRMRNLLSSNVAGLTGTSLNSLVDLGITTDQNNSFRLRLDSSRFSAALNNSAADVQALLADQRRASDDLVRFNAFSNATVAGSYDVDIQSLATQGRQQGSAGFSGPITIDDNNDTLRFTVDGVSTSAVVLTQGTYKDPADLAVELQNRINADSALRGSGARVEVSYLTDEQRFEVVSDSYGSGSSVAINAVDPSAEATFGLSVDNGLDGRGSDVAGTINGVRATGSGQFLTLPSTPQPASAGFFLGTQIDDPEATLTVVDGDNTFSATVDGTVSGSLSIAAGDYTGAELATAIADAINADRAISGANLEVSAAFNPQTGALRIESGSSGSRSRVDIGSVAQGLAGVSGLTSGTGNAGAPSKTSRDDAAGIQVQIIGGEAGPRGQVTLVRGAMNQLDRYLDSLVESGGSIEGRLSGLDEQLEELDRESQDFERRMTVLEERLRIQFAAADALISQLNNTSEFLDSQLSSLANIGQNN